MPKRTPGTAEIKPSPKSSAAKRPLATRLHAHWITSLDQVARTGSIREAARRLNVAPSAITRQIRDLEAQIGTKLIERLPRRLRLTAAGEFVAKHAQTVLYDLDRMRGALEDLRGLRRGHVVIAAVDAAATQILPRAIAELLSEHPRVTYDTRIEGSFGAVNLLVAGEVDVALSFLRGPPSAVRQWIGVPIPIGAVVRPDHPLARRKTIRLHDLAEFPLILPHESVSTRSILDDMLRRTSLELKTVVTSPRLEFMRALAREGAGIAFQSPVGLERELSDGSLAFVPLVEPGFEPPKLSVLTSNRRPPHVATEMVAEKLRAALAALLEV